MGVTWDEDAGANRQEWATAGGHDERAGDGGGYGKRGIADRAEARRRSSKSGRGDVEIARSSARARIALSRGEPGGGAGVPTAERHHW